MGNSGVHVRPSPIGNSSAVQRSVRSLSLEGLNQSIRSAATHRLHKGGLPPPPPPKALLLLLGSTPLKALGAHGTSFSLSNHLEPLRGSIRPSGGNASTVPGLMVATTHEEDVMPRHEVSGVLPCIRMVRPDHSARSGG